MAPAVPEEQSELFATQPMRLSAIHVDELGADVLDGVIRRDQPAASRACGVRHIFPLDGEARYHTTAGLAKASSGALAALLLLFLEGGTFPRGLPTIPLAHSALSFPIE
jgi:hypothetical protein